MMSEKSKYRTGLCDAYAIALNRLFGFQIVVFAGLIGKDECGDNYEFSHIACEVKGKYLDVDGLRSAKEIKETCLFTQPIKRIKIIKISEQEAGEIFTMEGVSESQISDAKKFILKRLSK